MGWLGRMLDLGEPVVRTAYYPVCYTSSSVPGREVLEVLGMVKAITDNISGKYRAEDDLVTEELRRQAAELGANAIVNFRYETGIYQKNGSSFIASYLIAYGDAVRLE